MLQAGIGSTINALKGSTASRFRGFFFAFPGAVFTPALEQNFIGGAFAFIRVAGRTIAPVRYRTGSIEWGEDFCGHFGFFLYIRLLEAGVLITLPARWGVLRSPPKKEKERLKYGSLCVLHYAQDKLREASSGYLR